MSAGKSPTSSVASAGAMRTTLAFGGVLSPHPICRRMIDTVSPVRSLKIVINIQGLIFRFKLELTVKVGYL